MAEFPEIPGYKIISKLGEGGMAAVYLGIQENLNRKVAIKILEPSLIKDKETRLRFEREAKTAASLSNSNIIRIFDTGKEDDYYYIVMEYLQDSLKDRMKGYIGGRMPPGIAMHIIEELMAALDYMGFRGVYHRDIKPENIMFRHDNTPVLVDFGIARAIDKTDGEDLTKGNIVPGSPHYMSPEQCKAQEMDWRSDIYSLGVVLYELLTGKKPFADDTSIAIVLNHIQSPIPILPEELSLFQPLIDKMMAKNRSERLRGGPEFIQLVDKISNTSRDFTPEKRELPRHQTKELHPSQPPPHAIPLEAVPPDSTAKEKESPIKLLFKKCLDLVLNKFNLLMKNWIKKLDSFIKVIKAKLKAFNEKLKPYFEPLKKKLNPIIESIKKILDPIIARLVKKMPFSKVLWIIFLGVIFIVIIIWNFGPPGRKSDSNANQSFIYHYIEEFYNYLWQSYQKKLKDLESLLKEKDLEKIKKGQEQIENLLRIKLTPELVELGEKIANRIKELEAEFIKHFKTAWDFYRYKKYSEARESLLQAKEIKTTGDLMFLEKRIEEKAKKTK